ncbi:MAG: S-layer homology domain-containing protein, partial [Firmicutes bacterium]|nr:S-layer homology domain-containing protein [Bacillota bacterium]
SIKGKSSGDYWLKNKKVTVNQGATAYHALLKALEDSGITQTGAASGYIKSMTKDGVTLAEFGEGPNSGWLYKVNNLQPDVGFTSYTLSNGDKVLWYYTTDWTQEPGSESFIGGGTVPEKDKDKDKEKEEKPANMPQFSDFTDLNKDQWYCEAVEYVLSNGLMQGTSKDTFKPDAKLSRSMLVQILYNMKDKPEAAASLTFGDVSSDSWYADAVHWAAENKLITGYSNGDFGPNDNITREQLAVILYRFAGLEKMDTAAKGDLSAFNDGDTVSSYAEDALKWAQANKIINGKPGQILDPQGTASRAEVAQILLNFSALVK